MTIEAGDSSRNPTDVTENEDRHRANSDRGWAWFIALAGFIVVFLGVGVYRVLGILMVELMDVYDASATQTSLIITCAGIGLCVSALLLIFGVGDIFQERALISLAGLCTALGFIVTYLSTNMQDVYVLGFCTGASMQIGQACSSTMVGKYFKKRLSIGMGLVMAGVSVATLLLPPFIQYLFEEYTYRGAALIMAGVTLNIFVGAALMRPVFQTRNCKIDPENRCGQDFKGMELLTFKSPTKRYSQNEEAAEEFEMEKLRCQDPPEGDMFQTKKEKSFSVFRMLRSFAIQPSFGKPNRGSRLKLLIYTFSFFKQPTFVFFELFIFFATVACECLIQFYPAFTKELGMTSYQSAFLLSIVGGSDLIGRLFFGILGDCNVIKRDKLVMIPQYVLGCACFLSRFATQFWSQVIFAVIIGLNYGVSFSFRAVVLVDLFGLPTLLRRIGVTNFVSGMAYALGTPIVGTLRDITGDFKLPLQLVGLVFFASGSSLLAIAITTRCQENRQQRKRQNTHR